VVSFLLLVAAPGAFLAALGLNVAARTPVRRALGWIGGGLLLAVAPLGWLPYWSDKQGYFFPVVFALGAAGVLYGLATMLRRATSTR